MTESESLVDQRCVSCAEQFRAHRQFTLDAMKRGIAHPGAGAVVDLFDPRKGHICRRCRLVRFAEAMEQLLRDGVPTSTVEQAALVSDEGNGGLTTEEYALLFESSVRELHSELVLR